MVRPQRYNMYIQRAAAAAAAAALCCCTAVVAAPAAAVRHRVSDRKKKSWFIESDFICCFHLFILKHYLLLTHVPLGNFRHPCGFDFRILRPRQ